MAKHSNNKKRYKYKHTRTKNLTANKIDQLQKIVKIAIYNNQNGEVETLKKDLINGPAHVFDCHKKCKEYYCDNVGSFCEDFNKIVSTGLQLYINSAFDKQGSFALRFNDGPDWQIRNDGKFARDADISEVEMASECRRKLNELHVTERHRISIADRTVGQFDNSEYIIYKTASLFGNVVKRQDHTPCDCLVQQIFKDPSVSQRETEAMKYGKRHEYTAIKMFELIKENEGLKVVKFGLYIDTTNSFLGASPAGITNIDAIIEVKCLHSLATQGMDVFQACDDTITKNKICVKKNSDGTIQLKRTHNYYYQVKNKFYIHDLLLLLFADPGSTKYLQERYVLLSSIYKS